VRSVWLSLRTRLLLAFALALAPVLIIPAVELRADYLRQVDTILTDQLQTAQAVAALVDASFDEGLALAHSLSVEPEIQSLDPSTADPHLQRQQSLFPQYTALALYDASGRNVGSSVPFRPGEERPSIADRPYFQRVMATNQEQLSEVLVGRISHRPVVILAYPVRDPTGAPKGVLAISLDLDRLPGRLAHVQLGPGQAILLADRTGHLAFNTASPDLPREARDYSGLPAIQKALAGQTVLEQDYYSPLLRDRRLAAFVASPEHQWAVGVSQPVDVALGPVWDGVRRDVAVAVAAGLLAIGLGLVVSRRVLDPVRRLTQRARELGRTLGQPGADPLPERPAKVSAGDELEVLGDSLDRMAREVQRRVAEVEGANARLAALTETAETLVGQITVQDVAQLAVERGTAIVAGDTAVLWLADVRRQELRLLASRNLSAETVAALDRIPFDSPLPAAQAARTGALLEIEDLTATMRGDDATRELVRREGIRGLVVAPLRTRSGLAGVLSYGRRRPVPFAPPEKHTAGALADVFAVALERAQLIHDLRAALRVREEFVNLAAHELKTPLTTFKGYTQVLMRRGSHDEEEARLFRTINVQSDRMAHVIDTLVDVSQIQSGDLVLRPTRVDLCQLVQEVVRVAQEAAPRHELSARCEDLAEVEADRERIREVLLNLLENAAKYSPRGGPVEVTVEARAGDAIVSVRDYGIGIPEEKQAQLFEAFYQVAPMVSPTTGMGLGLYISREIVRRHGGRIWFRSEEAKGSTFSFSLHLAGAVRSGLGSESADGPARERETTDGHRWTRIATDG